MYLDVNVHKCEFWIFKEAIPKQICDYMIKLSEKEKFLQGLAGKNDLESRLSRNNMVQFSEVMWVNALIYGYARYANAMNYQYKLSEFDKEAIQISKYGVGEYYGKHLDYSSVRDSPSHTRKLSISVQLSDTNDYEGGDLKIYLPGSEKDSEHTCPREQGTIIVFDSRLTHEVTPVTSGTRYSLVKWIHGDNPMR